MNVWKTAIAIAAVALTASAADAAAQVRLSIAGGPSFPTGSDNHLDTGYHVQVGGDLSLPLLPFGLRLDGAFNRFTEDHGNYDVLHGTASGVFSIPLVLFTPYIIGGIGMYSAEDAAHGGDRETNLGANIGAGVRLPLPGLSVFAEARLHAPFEGGQRFIPVSLGFRF
jgi:hypothetical protein